MSDGGGESGRENEQDVKNRVGSDDFGRAIAKIAVAQICECTGFQSIQQSALEALSDILIRYLCDLGKTAHFYVNLAGRTDCNIFDIFQVLGDLGCLQSISRASNVNHCLAGSGTVQEIIQYVNLAEEIQFAQPLPRFPVIRNPRLTPSFLQIGETSTSKHIPAWLPAFPDPHTYIHTPMWNERSTDPRTEKIEQARQRRKAEQSLLSLQQRLKCNVSAVLASVDPRDDGKLRQVVVSNPFLTTPFQFEEKDVSPVVLSEKLSNETVVGKPVSVLETFAPAIEAVKSGFCDSVDGDKNVLQNKRPAVNFKFGICKKSLGSPPDLSLKKKGGGKTDSWFGDDEKDDKKRRAKQILKESMENPQELAQL
ncbi:hypothetical protein HHK36_024441 [Tetracentron sinense]|uniref:Transcription initiation factor TFIID subunit 8 n=1 Tax=Tetracentron sinense TaxID=13715 RepID=A0A834YK98_TETSI|nr:hypothetical protein HHK36_024441 [Tetracentron sinense]